MTVLLRLRGLGVTLGNTPILDGIDLEIAAGARHVIIGHNGAGKSTLLNVIAGQVAAARGRIWFDGRDVTRLPPHRRARAGIARTWQHPGLFAPLTVDENLRVAMRGVGGTGRVGQLVDRFDVAPMRHRPVRDLPYGVQRRVELMIALAARPKLLLLDEPTAGLSPAEVATLMGILATLEQTTTVVLTDHHPDVITTVATSSTYLTRGRITDPSPMPVTGQQQHRHHPTAPVARGEPALRVESLSASYGPAQVLRDVACTVHPGQVVAIVAGNGAGKSTLFNTVAGIGLAQAFGSVHLGVHAISGLRPAQRQQLGLSLLPQERRLFGRLTVAENLRLPAAGRELGIGPGELLFKELHGRRQQRADTLSGGEQQMLAFARAVVSGPKVLLLDEPFEGLAMAVAARMRELIRQIAQTGTGVLIADNRGDAVACLADEVHHLVAGRLEPSA